MYDRDGDIVIKEVEEKINDNVDVTKQDLIALTFTPIMSGKQSKLDKIIKSIRLIKKIDNQYRYDVESMLYAFADKWHSKFYIWLVELTQWLRKFLDGKDLEKVKEEISMTKLGEMLVEDGIKKGREEQATDTAIKAIKMGLDNEAISNLRGLTEKEINMLRRVQNN